MLVRLKPGVWPDLPKMQRTIHDAGYKPIDGEVILRLTGKVVKQGDVLVLELDGMKTPIMLPLESVKAGPDIVADVERKHLGQAVEVEGRWRTGIDAAPAGLLAVISVSSPAEKVDSK